MVTAGGARTAHRESLLLGNTAESGRLTKALWRLTSRGFRKACLQSLLRSPAPGPLRLASQQSCCPCVLGCFHCTMRLPWASVGSRGTALLMDFIPSPYT